MGTADWKGKPDYEDEEESLPGAKAWRSCRSKGFSKLLQQVFSKAAVFFGNQLAIFVQGAYRRVEIVVHRLDERQVEEGVGKRWIHLRGHFVMKLREAKIINLKVKIREIVMRFCMTRVVL